MLHASMAVVASRLESRSCIHFHILNDKCMRIGCSDDAHISAPSVAHVCMLHRNPAANVVFQLEDLMHQARSDVDALARLSVAVPLAPQALHITRFMSPESLVAAQSISNPYRVPTFPMALWDRVLLSLPGLPSLDHRTLFTLSMLSLPLSQSVLRFVIQFSIHKLLRLGYARNVEGKLVLVDDAHKCPVFGGLESSRASYCTAEPCPVHWITWWSLCDVRGFSTRRVSLVRSRSQQQ
jgi:hypothetical protein